MSASHPQAKQAAFHRGLPVFKYVLEFTLQRACNKLKLELSGVSWKELAFHDSPVRVFFQPP